MANGTNLFSVYAKLCDCVLLFGARSAYVLPMYIVRVNMAVYAVCAHAALTIYFHTLNSRMRTSFMFVLSLTPFAVLLLQTNAATAATLRSLNFVLVCWLECLPCAQMRIRLSLISNYFGQTFALRTNPKRKNCF